MSRRRIVNAETASALAAPAPPGPVERIALDILVVGAGLTGINTAYRLQT